MATGWVRDSTAWLDAEGWAQPDDGSATPPQWRTVCWMAREVSMARKKWARIFPTSNSPEWVAKVERVRSLIDDLHAAIYALADDRPMIVTSPTSPPEPQVRYEQTELL